MKKEKMWRQSGHGKMLPISNLHESSTYPMASHVDDVQRHRGQWKSEWRSVSDPEDLRGISWSDLN
jgi:hypothetical protein